jgi:Mg2+/citrate symporter
MDVAAGRADYDTSGLGPGRRTRIRHCHILWRVVRSVAPIVATFIFAILYFCIMTGAGMLDPIIDRILHMAGASPTRIVLATAVLALLVHLDGSGPPSW